MDQEFVIPELLFASADEDGYDDYGYTRWEMPRQNEDGTFTPGEWITDEEIIVTDSPNVLWVRGLRIYECEVDASTVSLYHYEPNEFKFERARLIKPFNGVVRNKGCLKEQHIKDGLYHRDGDMPAMIFHDGSRSWYKNGKLHRDRDLPAVIDHDGTLGWYQNGERHRDNDQPAVIDADGTRSWYRNGKLHRDNDLPAIIGENDSYYIWYQNGFRHRDNNQPAVIHPEGETAWYKNGHLHRDNDLPALIDATGAQHWYSNGQRHREGDRPAIVYRDEQYNEYWLNGIRYNPAK